jgi:hypothetical protein
MNSWSAAVKPNGSPNSELSPDTQGDAIDPDGATNQVAPCDAVDTDPTTRPATPRRIREDRSKHGTPTIEAESPGMFSTPPTSEGVLQTPHLQDDFWLLKLVER